MYGTWIWLGDMWINPAINTTPARTDGRLAYDGKHNWVALFGGFRDNEYLNDTWELTLPQDLTGLALTATPVP